VGSSKEFHLRAGERLIRKGPASFQAGSEMVGGRLVLTSARLVFTAHALNLSKGAVEIPLGEIAGVSKGPKVTSVQVHHPDGSVSDLIVFRRSQWIADIEDCITGLDRQAATG
jgi:hypothetical protein